MVMIEVAFNVLEPDEIVNLEQLDRVSFIHCQLYFQSILIQSG
jgi:hypothetical protein